MSPDTDKKMTRRRAGIALATLGVCAAVPFTLFAQAGNTPNPTSAPEAITPGGLAPGQSVPADKKLPASLAKMLKKKNGPVVAGFVLPDVNDDERVREWLISLQKNPKFADTAVMIFRVTPETDLADIPEILDMTATPVVAVFQRDGKLASTWRGIVDDEMLQQAVIDARKNIPSAVKLTPTKGGPYGNAAGIALAKKVNAHYKKVPSLMLKAEGVDNLPFNKLTGAVSFEQQVIFNKGLLTRLYEKGTTADGVAYEALANRKGMFMKRQNMNCWIRVEDGLSDMIMQPVLPLQAYTFSKPVVMKKKKGMIALRVKNRVTDQSWLLQINKATNSIVVMRRDKVTNKLEEADAGGTVTPAPTAKKAAKKATKKKAPAAANPAASWPVPTPICESIG